MKIYIITMDDPVFTLDFFMDIIRHRYHDIAGLAIATGGRLKIGKKGSKIKYLFSLLIIMGPFHFFKNVVITVTYKLRKQLRNYFRFISDGSLTGFAEQYNIPVIHIDSPNNLSFLEHLRGIAPDLVINQSQYVIKKQLLEIPRLGVLNRHNALLPKNRGRLTPFWVINNGEKETGVTIHLVDEGIDSGPIVVQKRFIVEKNDTFNSIAKKNYKIASSAMLEALSKLEYNNCQFLENNSSLATYNTIPTLSQALSYRWRLIKRYFYKSSFNSISKK